MQLRNLVDKMNVLVYTGNGTTTDSIKHTLYSLRTLLSPYYAVIGVDSKVLLNEPWQSKTALLVFPGGADLPFCRQFNGEGNQKFSKFVRQGGKYLGLCAGGYYASARCEFEVGNKELEVSGPRELKFFPGIARGTAFGGFQYKSEAGARSTILDVDEEKLPGCGRTVYNYYNGGGVFVDADQFSNVEVLATYRDHVCVDFGSGKAAAAVVGCSVGKGYAILTGTHPEYTHLLMKKSDSVPDFERVISELRTKENERLAFLRSLLHKFGLKVNDDSLAQPTLTPLHLTSLYPEKLQQLVKSMETNIGYTNGLLKCTTDRFRLSLSAENLQKLDQDFQVPEEAIKQLVVHINSLPDRKDTPFFNLESYYNHLKRFWTRYNHPMGDFGSTLIYGEVLTSTSSLMDKNANLLRLLPHGFTITGTTQVSGKGRGGNVWINPPGVLAVSTVMKLPTSYSERAPIVFIQYLATLAYIEAILRYDESGLYSTIPLRIKWPNDIYILKPEFVEDVSKIPHGEAAYVKVGGILLNTNIFDEQYHMVAGCGLNVNNAAPTTSVNSVISAINEVRAKKGLTGIPPVEMEVVLAGFLYHLERMFNEFKTSGFSPFLDLYYRRWLHTGQIVHIQHQNNIRAKITGITEDWGMLIAQEVDSENNLTGARFELQPDGNSFDMFNGLISKKN
ncbi:Biotin:apoprotein ligase, covalently modifies proteins with the addition of biotin [Komagataella phaffii GS115]|uniref:Biotin:apoprotein ligase, covalently modifies proteins with the addition of biotin n=2 Tax=Komagataella phaffii TaxID=460519 RepID=C4R4Y1_KOMPG|nr:Biotin:apoprotein ligase, covalently modifies proteins with the addition of biotin [Komagataella phaffii GS115]AOA63392.1 GQ67_03644T0 [Komagataella phaffii]AOA69170.1 GQ68_03616T0 [Komagataella phaffii GS115]CAY70617.1 Biotin:apoprotein ligase, covalently modifies proteins with the addition of biotin [Komagataella phaffii GS115]